MSSFLKYWIPPILWACLISVFSTDSFSSSGTSRYVLPFLQFILPHATPGLLEVLHGLTRKLAHWIEYFILAILLHRAFGQRQDSGWQLRWAAWTLGAILLCSLADELHQVFVPTRGASLRDSLLDFFGGSCAVAVLYVRHRQKTKAATQPVDVLNGPA